MKLNLLNDMARICRLLSLLLLLAVGLAGCKTSRHSSSLSGESACLSSKVQLTVPHKDATLTVNGTMKLKKEECMQISFLMPILRTEVARMEVTPDEILLVDRMGKRYVRATRKELKDVLPKKADFAHLEKLLYAASKPNGKKVLTGKELGIPSLEKGKIELSNFSGKNLTCIFVDHGLLRKNEFENVMRDYEHLGLNVIGVNAKDKFYKELAGVTEPEKKRKIIGKGFIDVFDEEAHKLKDIKWLGQGTIYPDVIESLSITGTVIKSHHNVGGLPDTMNLKLVEPLRLLFKDEVRRVGMELGMQPHLIKRHPFPGPGLGIRILGDITPEKVRILQDADDIYMSLMREWGLYDKIWQAGVILLPIQSVGVMGDERTYENTVALRAVTSTDAMTADWAQLPYEFLAKVSNEIINKVKGVNRVVYDISSKPPATIEWE